MPNRSEKRQRRELFEADPHCHWCGVEVIEWGAPASKDMPPNAATLDHLVTRAMSPKRANSYRGPKVLACLECNLRRNREEIRSMNAARAIMSGDARLRDP